LGDERETVYFIEEWQTAISKLSKERNMDQMNRSDSLTGGKEISSYGSQSTSGGSTLDTIKDTVADKLHAAAGAIQQKAGQNQENAVGGYAGQAAGWLDDAAEYVREVDPHKVKSDIQHQVRSNPGRSLLVAGAAGILIGILLRR
jgi:ElaB/YqjD/DUF883 family membrane-anchored ribosome-binding protein